MVAGAYEHPPGGASYVFRYWWTSRSSALCRRAMGVAASTSQALHLDIAPAFARDYGFIIVAR